MLEIMEALLDPRQDKIRDGCALLLSRLKDRDIERYGGRLLNLAVRREAFKPAWALLDRGARVDGKDDVVKASTLHYAATSDDVKLVQRLIERGARIADRTREGKTPIHYAHDPRIVAILLANNASIDMADDQGNTPLHDAISMEKDLETVRSLLDQGAAAERPNHLGVTPLQLAKSSPRQEVLALFPGSTKKNDISDAVPPDARRKKRKVKKRKTTGGGEA
jgi:ankyrin repeat protein